MIEHTEKRFKYYAQKWAEEHKIDDDENNLWEDKHRFASYVVGKQRGHDGGGHKIRQTGAHDHILHAVGVNQ